MKSLIEMGREIEVQEANLEKIQQEFQDLALKKLALQAKKEKAERDLYEKKILYTHIKEIFRLAKIQFSRFRGDSEYQNLTPADIQELDKWIGRVNGEEGLLNIIKALMEVFKYQPSEIKSNIYALLQKIIIEGPYKKKGK